MLLGWVLLVVLSRNKIIVIGDLVQSSCALRVRSCAPPYLASMYWISPLCILSSLSLSLRTLISCLPMHLMYAFFSEKNYKPNMSCGSCLTTFNMHFGRSQIVLCRVVTFMSSFLMARVSMGLHRSCKQYQLV